MLEAAGLKVAILRAAPNKREAWVEKQVKAGVDVIITHPRKVETGIDLLDFPTLIWMAIDYSVYTVLQASRRSWRIGQTEPVKVYFFAYEETIQEDALQLVAAKVAAALRVNGDTVGDDTLADLDQLTSGDLVATLAKIVTGETQIGARSLQQAFAEANAGLRQANTLIGEYSIVEDDDEGEELETAVNGNGWTSNSSQRSVQPLTRPSVGNGHSSNGLALQPSLFANGRVKANGTIPEIRMNGQVHKQGDAPEPVQPAEKDMLSPPPVPRPRLVLNRLAD
jgi:hypothetical protein